MDVQEKLEEVLDFIEGVDEGADPYDLIVAREVEDDDDDEELTHYEFKRAKTVGGLPEELGSFTKERIENKRKALASDTKEGVEYAAANISDQSDYVQHVPADDVPRFEQYQDLLTVDDFRPTDYITEEGDEPDFQVILIRDGTDDRALVFQDITRREILAENDKIRFWSNDDHYTEIEETIIEVPNRIDAVYYDEHLFIFNQRRFEKIFDYMDEFNGVAEDTIETIVDSDVPIHMPTSSPGDSQKFWASTVKQERQTTGIDDRPTVTLSQLASKKSWTGITSSTTHTSWPKPSARSLHVSTISQPDPIGKGSSASTSTVA